MSRKKAPRKLDAKVERVGEKGVVELEEESDDEKVARLIANFAQDPPMRTAADLQVRVTAPGSHIDNENVKTLFANGASDLYFGMAPSDATETLLSTLAVSVANASLNCLMQAAQTPPEHLPRRDLNLRHGFKGAAVAAELIKVLDARRGHSAPRKVSVGSVNVEAGGQAIVGNVEPRRLSDKAEPCGSEVVMYASKP